MESDKVAIGDRRIYGYYEQAGYLSIPGYYNTDGKDNHCKICGCENRSATAGHCPDCGYRYDNDHKANRIIAGVPVRTLTREEWQVFQAIAKQIASHEMPFATVEEYAAECRVVHSAEELHRQEPSTLEQQIEAILYR